MNSLRKIPSGCRYSVWIIGDGIMKTRMFVAEILWLFLGLSAYPHSGEQTSEYDQHTNQRTVKEKESFLKKWHSSSLIRPPPWRDQNAQ
jgi:hypothetical protein